MLKYRLIPVLILKNDRLVQSIQFKRYLPIGGAKIAIEFFVNWDVDEIVLLDIDATLKKRQPQFDLISFFARKCFVPFTVGGGISSLDDIRNVIKAGADKVCLNTAAIRFPELITRGAERFGTQCITISIDAKKNSQGEYEVYLLSGKEPTGMHPVEWAQKVEALGAGEILLTSIERDGTKQGYDLELTRQVAQAVSIPVIACGGVGRMEHFVEGILKGSAHAVAAANIFQYTEHSTIIAKAYLKKANIDIRLSSDVTYEGFTIDEAGRIT
ncbi:MAG: imidazole glycerol phosphate synthase subunit HisF [Deltaproteobacteria bacterium RIFCSPLOWO2_12_FULL_40_28]|nr:MAG: imidazole glycerol phosphate synthase subunit HisF [Deltaproteobacteria bacterium RIFCSPHIGHO2_02_FULL_40_28]OGQ19583.1 MAG: imidazole glycerol phosphate synthase subunit HisF [Deltaproteobacteria bacterium RIFCSPHIGHO2_12_FULL_40_32]OGQ40860.1 MAG: imidazole glycerol phosphate synthase subunit HisF [Deltaproteobacteria bacterium RIFCSPLOWO2_02_FULL_40_36]OGQ53975.1 MAG: imidazole glycerol phosphate synthase subunit HisF [Deltaproteobacteria bacterium RIFCSPLOWO2_12_FULL_40_28]